MHPYVLAPLLNSSTGALLKFLGDEAAKRRQGRSVRAPCPLTPPPVRTNVPTLRHQGKTGRAAEQSGGGGDAAHGATDARPADSHTLRACMRVSLSLSHPYNLSFTHRRGWRPRRRSTVARATVVQEANQGGGGWCWGRGEGQRGRRVAESGKSRVYALNLPRGVSDARRRLR